MGDEQVQVREGVWRLRNGWERQIEPMGEGWKTRDIDGNKISWWKDGRFSRDYGQHEWDLVEYVGPLPGTEPEPAPEPAPEPQPVEIREGVWRTRDGRQMQVRESTDWRLPSHPWTAKFDGEQYIWMRHGRFHAEADSPADLVAYLRPLPKAESTTETLVEIEQQAAEDLQQWMEATALQRRRLEAELSAMTAERDRLQRELADMTKHSGELLESAQQARDERDLLAQRLMTKPSEEALQKRVAKSNIEINTLKDQLEAMATDRETVWRQFAAMTADRDRLQAAVSAATAEAVDADMYTVTCKRLQAELATMTSERDELATELEAMTDHCRRQHEQIRTLQAELDAAGQQPAPADKSEQIERIWDEARERAVSEIIELLFPLQVARGTHAESVLQILPAVIRRWMDGGPDDVE